MIDLNKLHDASDEILKKIARKDPSFEGEKLLKFSLKIREMRIEIDELRKKRNEYAAAAKGGITEHIRQESIKVGEVIKQKEAEYIQIEKKFNDLYLRVPNIPFDDIPDGGKESNKVVKEWGQQPSFIFEPLHHIDIGEKLGWFDFKKAATMTGSNFAFYKGDGVRAIYALAMYMLKNNIKHGYEPVLPPYLINEESLVISGNFPKFKEQAYAIGADNLFLTPTSEVNIANMYRDHIFAQEELPVRLTAYTSCFRREAGAYGASERGLVRIHQFEKVELYTICEPHHSSEELDRMIACAESILQALGIHYRISLLAAQDCSFQSAKTYDIEVWFPYQKKYCEVSSASNCTDFQARRGLMRYKNQGKNSLVHTLNASSLALPRLMVALLETYQQEDGSIVLPSVLRSEGIFAI